MVAERIAERVAVNQEVYYFEPKKGWLRGKVVSVDGDKVTVNDHELQQPVVVAADVVHGYIHESYEANDPDLFHVSDLHVATLLYCIKERFEKLHLQYSLMGEMVLSVNPFQLMPFNNEEERKKYLAMADPRPLPPHIWQVAHKSFNAINLQGLNNQSIVISGESGSGKTENAKLLIAYLGQLSYMHSNSANQRTIADKIDESLKWSNPVMESFGNARTVRNDNSSRFGKYIKLFFDTTTGVMIGGQQVTYLLEKSRIIMQSKGERNYHVFYEMLAGLSADEKAKLGNLKTANDYRCLNGGETFTRRGVDGRVLNDAEEFKQVRHALAMIGVDKPTEWCIFRVLSAILHLMEIEFKADDNDKAEVASEDMFQQGAKLLGVDPEKLRECFIVKSRTSLVTILSSPREAEGFRNAFCKAIYVGLFDRLVEFVNASITPQVDCTGCKYVGLLDIFGFENFVKNSFEQICINYANESLQNHYNKYTFINDEEECKREGIQIPKIEFPDNSECVNMFNQANTGIFSMIDEECNFKGGTVERFTTNVWNQWGKNKSQYFVQPKSTIANQFGINHYAAFVNYNTEDWLEKNTDALKDDMYETLGSAEDEFIRGLLSSDKGVARRKQTVAIRFQHQLTDLRAELESTETQFIRCIKPNMAASPSFLDNGIVGSQLESAGVLQTIELKRQGYPVRRLLQQFCLYFYFIMPRSTARLFKEQKYSEASADFLNYYQKLYKWGTPNFAVGKTKVFLRAEVWSALERLALRRKAQLLARCKPVLRRWVAEYRERKRIELEKKLAEQKRLRELRAQKMEENQNGLPEEKMQWVENFSNIFPDLKRDVIMDIVSEADNQDEALAAVLSIQEQTVDKQEPSTFINFMNAAGVHRNVIADFIANDVKTVSALSKVSADDMKNFGCSDLNIVDINKRLRVQHATRTKYERLEGAIGSNTQDNAINDIKLSEQQRHQDDFDTKAKQLVDMGFPAEQSRLVLAHYNGDVQRAAARMLYGANPQKMKKNANAHGSYTTADANVQKLISMGASKLNAKNALRTTHGDVDTAVKMLFKS